MRRANRAPIFLSKFNSCQLDDWIERLDKLILKVSNIFFPFFFYNVFSFDGQPRSIPPPHFISKRKTPIFANIKDIVVSLNGTKDRINQTRRAKLDDRVTSA